jgi:thioredoxin-related protein
MPSLDLLQADIRLNNLKIFPINIGQEDLSKSVIFFKQLEIKNLDIYYDPEVNMAKKFSLRGLPTTILFDKEGNEFARIIGSIDFNNKEFVNWLSSYN